MAIGNLYFAKAEDDVKSALSIISLAAVTFIFGLNFSVIRNVCFDTEGKRYKNEYAVGPVKAGKWKHLPNIEYVSVFRQLWSSDNDGDGVTDKTGYRYDVNIWHDTSKHFTIYTSHELEMAFEMAKHIAVKLNVDLLDATKPNDYSWVSPDTD